MATLLNSEVCEVLEDTAISAEEMEEKLSDFLRKKCTRDGLSKDEYSTLRRLQEALKKETKPKKIEEWAYLYFRSGD